jgi:hypothetical protein
LRLDRLDVCSTGCISKQTNKRVRSRSMSSEASQYLQGLHESEWGGRTTSLEMSLRLFFGQAE